MAKWELGVFASVDEGLGVKLEVVKKLGIPTVQLHAPSKACRSEKVAKEFLETLKEMGVTVTVVFAGFEGESYADIPTTQETIGLVPAATREARLVEFKEIADFANLLGVKSVGAHLGFIHANDPQYADLVAATQGLLDYLAQNGQQLHLETGQETAEGLLQFIADVDRGNLFINFDPANMILYGSGEPIEALKKVGKYVRSVHCKDGTWSDKPGETWGAEVPLGKGDVGMKDFLATLAEIGYEGPLTIEREIPQEPERQQAEIGAGAELLNQIKAELGVA